MELKFRHIDLFFQVCSIAVQIFTSWSAAVLKRCSLRIKSYWTKNFFLITLELSLYSYGKEIRLAETDSKCALLINHESLWPGLLHDLLFLSRVALFHHFLEHLQRKPGDKS